MLRGARNKACNAGKASPGVRGVSQRRLWWTTAASSTARPQQAALEDVTTPSLPDAANGVEDDAGLSLTVSSPALLLNHMAERYSSTPRVLMEFVDNALDDAEAFFRRPDGDALDSAAGSYDRPVVIDVFVDRDARSISVRDNCRGMPLAVLKRVVLNVGESKKRGAAFLNGQYGFGMQAFRTACETLEVTTRPDPSSPALGIRVDRGQQEGFVVREVSPSATSAPTTTPSIASGAAGAPAGAWGGLGAWIAPEAKAGGGGGEGGGGVGGACSPALHRAVLPPPFAVASFLMDWAASCDKAGMNVDALDRVYSAMGAFIDSFHDERDRRLVLASAKVLAKGL